jgi:hypothetical protein
VRLNKERKKRVKKTNREKGGGNKRRRGKNIGKNERISKTKQKGGLGTNGKFFKRKGG